MSASSPANLRTKLRALFEPLNVAGYLTVALIAFDQAVLAGERGRGGIEVGVTLGVFLLAFAWRELASPATQRTLVLVQFVAALVNAAQFPSTSSPILGVIGVAQLPYVFRWPATIAIMATSLLSYGWIFHAVWGTDRPVYTVALYAGFQLFALLVARLAVNAERARDQFAEVNAHLLATRSLLEAGARDGERLRLSRELHDVAGHTLTALKLNIELALRLPDDARASRLVAARDLVDALLDDIGAVVGQLRRHDGVDLGPALRTLVERLPGPRIELDIEADLRIADVAQAEAALRCVQEALTNVLRHAVARTVRVGVRREAGAVCIEVRDDGRGRAEVVAGNGLTGMRERIEQAGGRLECETAVGQGFTVRALLPAAMER
jgi:signal transduction histidine kinase